MCSDPEPNCTSNDTDDCGVCGGNGLTPYYYDGDADGLGDPNDFVDACTEPENYVVNSDDLEPDCSTNDTDDCGVCAGGNADKDCAGDCFGEAVINEYCEDTDGDGLGNEESKNEYCDDSVPNDWVLDCNDECMNDPLNDIDNDGFCADEEECDDDPYKQVPGTCGCGVSDLDSDGDGAADCIDGNGDVDQNSVLNVLDLLSIVWHILDPDVYPFTDEQIGIADSNSDGTLDILDLVNFIDIILGDSLTRKLSITDKVNILFTSHSLSIEIDSFIGLDITFQYAENSNIVFEINQEFILGECEEISETRSRCLVATDKSGEILSANTEFEIVEIKAAIPGGFIKVLLSEVPLTFNIGNAYPNPFNPIVKFDYSIPIQSQVLVSVLDVNGRIISILKDKLMESGNYNLNWDASSLSSGVYFVHFNVNNMNSTQKVMLIK